MTVLTDKADGVDRAAAEGQAVLPLLHARRRAQPRHARQGSRGQERGRPLRRLDSRTRPQRRPHPRHARPAWASRRTRSSSSPATTAACSSRRMTDSSADEGVQGRPAGQRRPARRQARRVGGRLQGAVHRALAGQGPGGLRVQRDDQPGGHPGHDGGDRRRAAARRRTRPPRTAAIFSPRFSAIRRKPVRDDMIVHSSDGVFAIRKGPVEMDRGRARGRDQARRAQG